jgi:hypothetical protein
MARASHTFVLSLEDQGALLRNLDGQVLDRLPDAGPDRRLAWAESLKAHAKRGDELILLLGHAGLTVQCQDAPYLSATELRDTSRRMAAAEGAGIPVTVGAALDNDPQAEGGHVLWVAFHPRKEMQDLVAAADDAGMRLVQACPWARAITKGLDLAERPKDHMLLALDGETARLFVFKGSSLVLQRAFRLPEGEDEEVHLERLALELGRIQQFIKQRQKGLAVDHLILVGLEPPAPFVERLRSMRLKVVAGPAHLWPVLARGIARERKGGMNLVPYSVLEAERRRLARVMLWTAAILTVGLFAGGVFLLRWAEEQRAEAATRMEETLAQRKALQAQRHAVVGARVPLLRLRMIEQRQSQSIQALGRLGALLLEAPDGVVLEKVEIQQVPGDAIQHRFHVEGTALTAPSFSTGPLAIYLGRVQSQRGIVLEPLKEVQVLDRQDETSAKIDRQAVARFAFDGRAQ